VVSEAFAAVLPLAQLAAVDEDAPRTVEHRDALGEDLLEFCAGGVLHTNRLLPREAGSREAREAL
jgi:hypothetical protein